MITDEQTAHYAQLRFPVEAELSRRTMSMREIVALAPGSMLTLLHRVGATVTVFVGGTPFCSAEMIPAGKAKVLKIAGFKSSERS